MNTTQMTLLAFFILFGTVSAQCGNRTQLPLTGIMSDFLDRNAKFAAQTDPELFLAAVKGQTPKLLWIGCSDSRVPQDVVIRSQIGEVFVHKNIANLFTPTDMSSVAAVAYAVNVLKIPNIVVVGHTNCGGCKAALEAASGKVESNDMPGSQAITAWIDPIRVLAMNMLRSSPMTDLTAVVDANVREQVCNLASHPILTAAWARGQPVTVYGWVYDIGTGKIEDLGVSRSGP